MLRRGCKASERRRHLNDSLSWQQDQALSSSIYLLRQIGPIGFLLREEEPEKGDFRVLLGNPHECNCPAFLKRGELCKHICWVLLKKFKLPRDHESAFQLGLVEGEINDLLRGIHQVQSPKLGASDKTAHVKEDGCLKQKAISAEDICPICQEVMLEKKLPVTFCRFGCGNNVHIKCMKILSSYQATVSNSSMVKCPLCREEFAPLKLILEEFRNSNKLMTISEKERLDKHLGIPCNNCKQLPIEGRCYKCTECVEYHLCQECFDSCCHLAHTFAFREKRNQRWRSVGKRSDVVKYLDIKNEEETNTPYLQEKQGEFCTPKHAIKALPLLLITKNSKLLAPGYQCRLCLKSFCLGQYTRLLPCTHKFHRKCIDNWLFHECNACPIDRQVIYNPLLWKGTTLDGQTHQLASNKDITHLSKQQEPKFFVPGTGLVLKQNRTGVLPSVPQCNSKTLTTLQNPSDDYQNITIDDLCSVKLDNSDSRKLVYGYKVSQHFPPYLEDPATGSFGQTPSQTFLPSLVPKSIICLPGRESPQVYEKYHTGQSQKTRGCDHVSSNGKKSLGAKERQDKRSSTLPTEGFNLPINWGTARLSLSKRHPNSTGKVRKKYSRPPRRPAHPASQTQSAALSLIMEGIQL
ncbi:E3 ubiquitin-protein ligase ZSWIM2 [Cricetulus griseus]|uniref:RING-type E3 ubiquitin transferase n=1 Tax=Cricetulus griseus TaxID=10029 RepID=A0A061HY01_CRIGR|nr:E3 ubiquitin-protein ligase ZSWIM2 [Cricetulus griseus]ERE71792.1 E3 ubiquitin-protein ligase [Cricetulus griseus]